MVPSCTLLMCFSPFLCQENAGHSLLLPGGVSPTPETDDPRSGSTAPLFAMDWFRLNFKRVGLQNTCNMLMTLLYGATQQRGFFGKRNIIHILLKVNFAIKQSQGTYPGTSGFRSKIARWISSDSSGYDQKHSSYVPTSQQEGNTSFPQYCGF